MKKSTVLPQEIAALRNPAESHHSDATRDPVVVVRFPDGGGIISYEHQDGFVHTLNASDGFARKLAGLEIPTAVGTWV